MDDTSPLKSPVLPWGLPEEKEKPQGRSELPSRELLGSKGRRHLLEEPLILPTHESESTPREEAWAAMVFPTLKCIPYGVKPLDPTQGPRRLGPGARRTLTLGASLLGTVLMLSLEVLLHPLIQDPEGLIVFRVLWSALAFSLPILTAFMILASALARGYFGGPPLRNVDLTEERSEVLLASRFLGRHPTLARLDALYAAGSPQVKEVAEREYQAYILNLWEEVAPGVLGEISSQREKGRLEEVAKKREAEALVKTELASAEVKVSEALSRPSGPKSKIQDRVRKREST